MVALTLQLKPMQHKQCNANLSLKALNPETLQNRAGTAGVHSEEEAHRERALVAVLSDQPELQDLGLGLGLRLLAF